MEQNNEAPDILVVPNNFDDYTLEDFLTEAPYERIYEYWGNGFLISTATERMALQAQKVGYKKFRSTLKEFLQGKAEERKQKLAVIPNQTEFSEQTMELDCGQWESTDWGIYRENAYGSKEIACAHPIMPVERLVNIDTGEVKLKLAYKRSGKDSKWLTTIVGKDVVANARKIVDCLAPVGVSVTTETAKTLVAYLNDMENQNYERIPQRKSIGRLGYIEGEGFSPYVDGVVFDGDASFRNLYNTVTSAGSYTKWYDCALECRKQSVTARIMLAASFASPLLSVVGSLPFFVHLWGVDSGTGKTVALMLAASVWGNPALGSYLQTFNATQVGQERVAAFLNHLPCCLDELQLTKDSRGKTNFDVYQLAQGVGRARGKRTGGVEMTPTWSCCFLTTGESPLTSISAGAGAINRVIDIECTAGSAVLTDGHRISGILKQNYGWAGREFVERLYESDKTQDVIREMYQNNYRELCAGDSTEKQAMAAAAILTADQAATAWIFKDDMELTPKDIRDFLASKEAVSAGRRAYDWLCDWVASNVNRFAGGEAPPSGEVYGVLESSIAYINRSIFNRALQDAGFSSSATLSYLKSSRLIEVRGRAYTKSKRINGIRTECVALVVEPAWDTPVNPEDLLPL